MRPRPPRPFFIFLAAAAASSKSSCNGKQKSFATDRVVLIFNSQTHLQWRAGKGRGGPRSLIIYIVYGTESWLWADRVEQDLLCTSRFTGVAAGARFRKTHVCVCILGVRAGVMNLKKHIIFYFKATRHAYEHTAARTKAVAKLDFEFTSLVLARG